MQILIDISEKDFTLIRSVNDPNLLLLAESRVMLAVKNGTPLPEHHGRLIDVNELLDDIGLEDNDENRDCNNGEIITLENIDRISTIIPATKEGDF